jgi:hypothetical protein
MGIGSPFDDSGERKAWPWRRLRRQDRPRASSPDIALLEDRVMLSAAPFVDWAADPGGLLADADLVDQ